MSEARFTDFLATVFKRLAAFSEAGSIHYVCIDWKHAGELIAAGRIAYSELKNLCVWAKSNFGLGTFYRSQHELVFVFKSGTAKHINNFKMGGKGRTRSNLWSYDGANGFRKGRREDLADHPTVKPVQMVADAILDCSHMKGLILDAFCGAGTTLLAAERTGRRGYGIEIDPAYVDVALRRLEKETGEAAVLENGETFAQTAKRRLAKEEEV
jgi:DNA modification methylase